MPPMALYPYSTLNLVLTVGESFRKLFANSVCDMFLNLCESSVPFFNLTLTLTDPRKGDYDAAQVKDSVRLRSGMALAMQEGAWQGTPEYSGDVGRKMMQTASWR